MTTSTKSLQLTRTYSSENRRENMDTFQKAQKTLAAAQEKLERSILNVNYLDRKKI